MAQWTLRSASQIDQWADAIAVEHGEDARREYLRSLANDLRHLAGETSMLRPSRADEAAPEHVRAAHDAGFRAIERHQAVLTAEAPDRLDGVIRSADPVGIGGRYLAAVGDPHYNSAFGKMIMDPTHGHSASRRKRSPPCSGSPRSKASAP